MDFIGNFFDEIDEYIQTRINTITCQELADIYFRFIDKVESFQANTRDFTGLTEFIILRALNHLYSNLDNVEFLANTLVGKRQPDITIMIDKKYEMVISIKSNMDTGYSRIKKDYNKLKEIVDQYPEIRTFTISFDDHVTSGQYKLMDGYRQITPFYQFVFLRNNDIKFRDIANNYIYHVK